MAGPGPGVIGHAIGRTPTTWARLASTHNINSRAPLTEIVLTATAYADDPLGLTTAGKFAVKATGEANRTVRTEPIGRSSHANQLPPLSTQAACVETSGRSVAALPEKYRAQRYEVLAHQAGLEDEGPSVAYPEDPQPNGDRVLKEHSVICLEAYMGEVGGRDGVKLEDQLVLTADGARVLIPYPYCEPLL